MTHRSDKTFCVSIKDLNWIELNYNDEKNDNNICAQNDAEESGRWRTDVSRVTNNKWKDESLL